MGHKISVVWLFTFLQNWKENSFPYSNKLLFRIIHRKKIKQSSDNIHIELRLTLPRSNFPSSPFSTIFRTLSHPLKPDVGIVDNKMS